MPAHKTKMDTQYVAECNGALTLRFLPGYIPGLSPDELVWSYAKRTGTDRRPLQKGETLDALVTQHLMESGRPPRSAAILLPAPECGLYF